MIKRILLAVDLGPYTSSQLRHAVELSKQHNASLAIVHAIEPLGTLGHALLHAYLKPETTREVTTKGLEAMIEGVRTQVIDALTEEYLEGYSELLHLNQVIVRAGAPTEVILEVADDEEADLIVIGNHTNGMPGQLGTVAQKLLNMTSVPIYLVPSDPIPPSHDSFQHQLGLW